MPVVCNNRCFGSRSAENCGFSAVAVIQQGRRHPCFDAVAASHIPDCLEEHRDSPVALRYCDRCPFCTAVRTWNLDIMSRPCTGSLVRYSSPEQYNTDFHGDDFKKMFSYSSYALVRSGYKYMRQSSVALEDGRFCYRNAPFFGLRPSGR